MKEPKALTFDLLSSDNATLAKKAAELLENYQKLQDRHTALYKLNQLSIDCADLDTFYKEVHKSIASIMCANNFYIVMHDATFETLEYVYSVDEHRTFPKHAIAFSDLNHSLTHYVIKTTKPLFATTQDINDLAKENLVSESENESCYWLGVPLMSDGYVIGVMVLQSYSEDIKYNEQDLDLLTFTAQHIVTAMTRLQDRERLKQAVDARTRELMQQIRERERSELLQESLFKISELTNDSTLDINQFYHMVHNIVGQLINAENFYIAKYDPETQSLAFAYHLDQDIESSHNSFYPRKLANGYTELVIEQAQSVLLNYDDMYALYEQGKTRKPAANTKSWLGVPLIHNGETLGAMVVQSYQENTLFTEQDAELLKFVCQHVSSAIRRRELIALKSQTQEILEQQVKARTKDLEDEIRQRKRVEDKLKQAALHDHLTGLSNRTMFVDLLNHTIASHKRRPELLFAVLFLDLDRFKNVNDSLGHHAGDKLLTLIANELNNIIRNEDTVARIGGDEFVILIEDLESKETAYAIASRITEMLSTPFYIDNQPVFIGTSIGLLFNDKRYNSADAMLRDADAAMYHAKDMGKGRYEEFDASMHKNIQNALALEADIREGLTKSEFVPFFQPIVRLSNQKVVGFEALARWNSHRRGFVVPNDFIPLAEEVNIIKEIDFQILEKSCKQLKAWIEQLSCDTLYVSCNLFCHHFFSTTLTDDIKDVLDRVGLDAKNLRVELTERALLENSEIVLKNMNSLKALGVKILLDDFGTGYSSLSYVHRFPIDVLKIDRSFINNVHEHGNHRAIIKTIVELASNLEMETVGEGIETLADAESLHQMECSFGQGYYYAKPMSAEDTFHFLNV